MYGRSKWFPYCPAQATPSGSTRWPQYFLAAQATCCPFRPQSYASMKCWEWFANFAWTSVHQHRELPEILEPMTQQLVIRGFCIFVQIFCLIMCWSILSIEARSKNLYGAAWSCEKCNLLLNYRKVSYFSVVMSNHVTLAENESRLPYKVIQKKTHFPIQIHTILHYIIISGTNPNYIFSTSHHPYLTNRSRTSICQQKPHQLVFALHQHQLAVYDLQPPPAW